MVDHSQTKFSLIQGIHALFISSKEEYRQVFFKPYRLIYRIVGKQVVVYLIVDSRRDLQSLLARRLLGSW